MSNKERNMTIVAHWFKDLWGNLADLSVVDELGAPNVLFQYPMHGPVRVRANVKRASFRN